MAHFAKKLTPFLPFFTLLLAFPAHAAGVISDFSKGLSLPVAAAIYAIVWIILKISGYILIVSAALMNQMFSLSTEIPTNIPVVPIAWAALRDLTNGLFLLIILWIALTIIFNVEQWGGKRLLANVLLIALLINFSLLFVTMLFGFSNEISRIFVRSLPNDPGQFILDAIGAQSVGDTLTPAQVANIKTYEKQKELSSAPKKGAQSSSLQKTLLSSLGVKTADAVSIGLGTGCVGAILIGAAAGGVGAVGGAGLCLGGAVIGAIVDFLWGWSASSFDTVVNASFNIIIQAIFMLFTAVTLFVGSITLLIRYGVMIALSVIAPIALLAAMTPGLKKHFDLWLSTVLRWAFFAPLFFVMVYLGFYIIGLVNVAAAPGVAPGGDFSKIIIPFLGILFMWMGLKIARQTGGAVGEWGVNAIAKTGLFAAGGVAGLAMRGAGATLAAQPDRATALGARLRRIPGVGRKMEAGIQGLAKGRKEDIETRMKEVDHYSSEQLAQSYRSATSAREKAAYAAVLAKRKDLNKKDSEGRELLSSDERRKAMGYAEQFGVAKEIYKTNPHLIEKETREKTLEAKIKAMKEADRLNLAPEAYNDDETILALIANIRGRKELHRIAQETPAIYQRIQEVRQSQAQRFNTMINDMNRTSGIRQEGTRIQEVMDRYEANLGNEMNQRQGGRQQRRQRRAIPPNERGRAQYAGEEDEDEEEETPPAAGGTPA